MHACMHACMHEQTNERTIHFSVKLIYIYLIFFFTFDEMNK